MSRRTDVDRWLELRRFDYRVLNSGSVVAQLSGLVNSVPAGVQLVIARPGEAISHNPLLSLGNSASFDDCQSQLLWRAKFALSLEVVQYRDAVFTLLARDRAALTLPVPQLRLAGDVYRRTSGWPGPRIRQHVLAVGAGLAVAVFAGPAAAAAATGPGNSHHKAGQRSSQPAALTQAPMSCPLVLKDPAAAPKARLEQCTAQAGTQKVVGGHARPSSGKKNVPGHRPPSGGAGLGEHSGQSHTHHSGQPKNRPHDRPHASHNNHPGTRPPAHHSAPASHTREGDQHRPAPPSPPTISPAPAPVATAPVSAGRYSGPFSRVQLEQLSSLLARAHQPPAWLIPIYKAAGKRYHIPWRILAAINAIETNYGRDLQVSSAGAMGWMQFMPGTWRAYGVDVDGRGHPNPYDPRDAIFSAARYLAANGGAHHLRRAIFAYNHAHWYVDAVIFRARMIRPHALSKGRLHGYALPLDARYMHRLGRTDDGVDIETAPDGAGVYSIAPGIVTAVASDPAGFGPNYPVILVTRGPLKGRYIYYGHVAASLVKVGQHVAAGQPIAIMGHTGDAAGLGHGHIEIGFSSALGDPLDHHGATAWTPAGSEMRQVLVDLAAAFRIQTS
jgi:murein DD-endopeptidase MepM/ murein hydrolase activator NlpD